MMETSSRRRIQNVVEKLVGLAEAKREECDAEYEKVRFSFVMMLRGLRSLMRSYSTFFGSAKLFKTTPLGF